LVCKLEGRDLEVNGQFGFQSIYKLKQGFLVEVLVVICFPIKHT
jgi:hypothetical protein